MHVTRSANRPAASRPKSEAGTDSPDTRLPFDSPELAQRREFWKRIVYKAFRSFRNIPLEDAEDAFQELLLSYWAHQDRIICPEAWFFACARRKAHRLVTRRHGTEVLDEQTPSRSTLPNPDIWKVQQVFFGMSEHCRKILGCLVAQEWTVEELAAATRRKPRDLVAMGSRCLKSLQSRWQKLTAAGNETPTVRP